MKKGEKNNHWTKQSQFPDPLIFKEANLKEMNLKKVNLNNIFTS